MAAIVSENLIIRMAKNGSHSSPLRSASDISEFLYYLRAIHVVFFLDQHSKYNSLVFGSVLHSANFFGELLIMHSTVTCSLYRHM
jgi:hypothetical protein